MLVANPRHIQALRKAKGCFLQALAASAYLSVGYVSQVERDLFNPFPPCFEAHGDSPGVPIVLVHRRWARRSLVVLPPVAGRQGLLAPWLSWRMLVGARSRAGLRADLSNCVLAVCAARAHWLTHESNTDAMLLYDRIAGKPGFMPYRKLLA